MSSSLGMKMGRGEESKSKLLTTTLKPWAEKYQGHFCRIMLTHEHCSETKHSGSGWKCVPHTYSFSQGWTECRSLLVRFLYVYANSISSYHPCLLWNTPSSLWDPVFPHNTEKTLRVGGQTSTYFMHVFFVFSSVWTVLSIMMKQSSSS